MLKYNVSLEGKIILVTGAAGFIGSNLVKLLLLLTLHLRLRSIGRFVLYR